MWHRSWCTSTAVCDGLAAWIIWLSPGTAPLKDRQWQSCCSGLPASVSSLTDCSRRRHLMYYTLSRDPLTNVTLIPNSRQFEVYSAALTPSYRSRPSFSQPPPAALPACYSCPTSPATPSWSSFPQPPPAALAAGYSCPQLLPAGPASLSHREKATG